MKFIHLSDLHLGKRVNEYSMLEDHRLMKLDYDNRRTRSSVEISGATDVETKSPLELSSDFYELQNNQPMNPEQFEYMKSLIEKTWEGEQ